MSTRARISAIRAAKAFKYAEDGKSSDKYDAYVKRMPMLIRTNGLGNAIAFMYSNRDKQNGWGKLYEQLDDWFYTEPQKIVTGIMNNLLGIEKPEQKTKTILMETIIEIDNNEQDQSIRLMTMEVLALCNWLKRFV